MAGLFDDILNQKQIDKQPSVFQKVKGFLGKAKEAILEPPKMVGQDIAQLFFPEYQAAKESENKMLALKNELRAKTLNLPLDDERRIRFEKILADEVPTISEVLPERNARQMTGDIVETALYATPVPIINALKGLPVLARAVQGATIGGTFGLAESLREKEFKPKEAIKQTAIGAGLGAGISVVAPIIGKGIKAGASKTGEAISKVGQKAGERLKESSLFRFVLPLKTRLSEFYGEEGKVIVDKMLRADENKLLKAGNYVNQLEENGFFAKWIPEERANFVDLAEGRTQKVVSDRVNKAFKIFDTIRSEITETAKKENIVVRFRRGVEKPFKKIAKTNYFPHDVLPPQALKDPIVKKEVLENAVRIGKFETIEEAEKVLNNWMNIIENQGRIGREKYFVNYLVKNNQTTQQITDKEIKVLNAVEKGIKPPEGLQYPKETLQTIKKAQDEARGMILRFFRRSRLQKFGHLEYAREFDFPFYDPNPQRVVTKWILGAVDRLETIKEFGQKGQVLNQLLGAIKRKQGEELGREATRLVKVATGAIESGPASQKISLFMRMISVPKLAFSQIINLGQNMNTLLATDLPSFGKGLASVFSKEGRRQALKTGATLEGIIREMVEKGAGGEYRFAHYFLKYNGFQLTEKINRTVAANAGIAYAKRNFNFLLKNPKDAILKQRLEELGIDVGQALKRGNLTTEELLKAGQRIANITQFRYRALDLPAFANSDFGKVAFQFKTFAYNQTKFLKDQIVKEMTNGKPDRVIRTLIIFGIVFPMGGEVIRDVRSLITQEKRPTKALDRYLNNLMTVGGFGILSDIYSSALYGRLAETALGPTIGSITQTTEALIQSGKRYMETGDIEKGFTPGRVRQVLSPIGPLATYPHKVFFPSPVEEREGKKSTIQSLVNLADEVKQKFKNKKEIPFEIPKGGLFDDVLVR